MCPDPFPADLRSRLLRLAAPDYTASQVNYAIEQAQLKSAGGGTLLNLDWPKAILGYMREAWILRGYKGPTQASTSSASTTQRMVLELRESAQKPLTLAQAERALETLPDRYRDTMSPEFGELRRFYEKLVYDLSRRDAV